MATDSTSLRSVPTLVELVERPERAVDLPPEVARPLYVQVAALQVALSTAIVSAARPPVVAAHGGDRLLGPQEVADKIGKSRSWVEKNTAELPHRRRVGGEGLWSEREIEAWIRNRPRWD